jgi:starch synthase
VVRAVGGLHDTVTDGETGFVFIKSTIRQFTSAMQRALEAYQDRPAWRIMQQNGMAQDFSWKKSALQYFELYQKMLANRG